MVGNSCYGKLMTPYKKTPLPLASGERPDAVSNELINLGVASLWDN